MTMRIIFVSNCCILLMIEQMLCCPGGGVDGSPMYLETWFIFRIFPFLKFEESI